ncbi:MAG: restriction endonuclease subunit S [Polyangiaceae bacterium]
MGTPGLAFARAGNIKDGFKFANADFLHERSVALAGEKVSAPYDVVFTSKGTVGRYAFVDPNMERFVYSPQLCFWRSLEHEQLDPFVLKQWIESPSFGEQVDRVKGQTDMAEYVSLRDQRRMTLPTFSVESQRRIRGPLASAQRRVWHNVRESATLAQLRDALLPKLLSGELSVKSAERILEATA